MDGKSEDGVVKGKLHWVLILTQPHEGPTLMETAQFLKTPLAEKGFYALSKEGEGAAETIAVNVDPRKGESSTAATPIPAGSRPARWWRRCSTSASC